MKATTLMIVAAVLSISGLAVYAQCGNQVLQIPIQCNTDVCHSQVTLNIPEGEPTVQFVEDDQYCCGGRLTSFTSLNSGCNNNVAKNYPALDELRRSPSARFILIANCSGTYAPLPDLAMASTERPLRLRRPIPLL